MNLAMVGFDMEVDMKIAKIIKSENWSIILASVLMIGLIGIASSVL